jgi:MFS family permease
MNFAVGWRQVASVFYMLMLGTGIVFSSYGIVSAPIAKEFHASHSMAMMGVGAILLVGATMSPTIGGWIDRFSFRHLACLAAVLLSTGLMALSFAQSMWHVIAIYAVFMAIPAVLCGPMGASALLMRWFVHKRGRAMGIAMAGLSAGSFFFPSIIAHLIDATDWRVSLRLLSVFAAVTLIPVALLAIVNRPADKGLFADGGTEAPPEKPSTRAVGQPISIREIVSDRNFWLVSLALGMPMSAGTGTTSNIVLLAADIGVASTVAALVMSTIAVSSALGKLTIAVVGDKFDNRHILFVGMALTVSSMFTLAMAGSVPALFLGGALISFGSGLLNPLWGMIFSRAFDPAIVGKVMGLAMSVGMVLSVISPVLIGKLRDLTGTYEVPFLTYGVAILLTTILVRWIKLRHA